MRNGCIFQSEMKIKKAMAIIVSVIILAGIVISAYFCRVRFTVDPIGHIFKDEEENVESVIFLSLYNGTFKSKKVTFDVDGGEEYLDGKLKDEKYKISVIEILEGNAQIDAESMTMTIPAYEEVRVKVVAINTYIGDRDQKESVYLRRDAPETNIVIVE